MNWLVVGQGAMGLLWYHHLQQVQKIVHKNEINKINALSLLASKQQNLQQTHYQFTNLTNQKHQGVVSYAQSKQLHNADVVFLCLKSYHIASALKDISAQLKKGCTIILAHNGMGTLDNLPQTFINKHTIYALLTTHGCLRNTQLNITHTGAGESSIGLISEQTDADSTKGKVITDTLNTALPPVSLAYNIVEKQWLKLAINCVINPITALHNIDNGVVNDAKFTTQIFKLLTEITLIAKAKNITLITKELQEKVQQVAIATAKNCSSMRCDILENRPTEIDFINGYIHKLGLQYAIATPENTKMWQAVLTSSALSKSKSKTDKSTAKN